MLQSFLDPANDYTVVAFGALVAMVVTGLTILAVTSVRDHRAGRHLQADTVDVDTPETGEDSDVDAPAAPETDAAWDTSWPALEQNRGLDTGLRDNRPVTWHLAPGQTPDTDTDNADDQDEPAGDETEQGDPVAEVLDELHTHLTGAPSSNAGLASHPVTGDTHLRTRRTAGDPHTTPVARTAGPLPAGDDVEIPDTVEGLLPRIPDLPPGSHTSPLVPDQPDPDLAALLARLVDAAGAGDVDTAAAIADRHPAIAGVAHLAAAAAAGTGVRAAHHVAAAAHAPRPDLEHTTGDDTTTLAGVLEQLATLTVAVPMARHHAWVHVPATFTHAELAAAAHAEDDPDSVDVIETRHADQPGVLTHLLRLDAALDGRWPPVAATVPVTDRTRLPARTVHVPADTADALTLTDPAAVPGRRAKVDPWRLLAAHARATLGDGDAHTAYVATLDRYTLEHDAESPVAADGDGTLVEVDVDALWADAHYLAAVHALDAGDDQAAADAVEAGRVHAPHHPGLAAVDLQLRGA